MPFIARYRKEATEGLDDTQLRTLEERLAYLRELESRRAAIVASVAEQGKLTDALAASIDAAQTKQELEDLYLPYKPKRTSKASSHAPPGSSPSRTRSSPTGRSCRRRPRSPTSRPNAASPTRRPRSTARATS